MQVTAMAHAHAAADGAEPAKTDCIARAATLNTGLRGYGEKVSHELPKLLLRVRFPLPAPASDHDAPGPSVSRR